MFITRFLKQKRNTKLIVQKKIITPLLVNTKYNALHVDIQKLQSKKYDGQNFAITKSTKFTHFKFIFIQCPETLHSRKIN